MGNFFSEICCGIFLDLFLILTIMAFLIVYCIAAIWTEYDVEMFWISIPFLGVGLVLSIVAMVFRIKDKKIRLLFKVLSWIIGSAGIIIGYIPASLISGVLFFTLVFDCACTIPSTSDTKNQAINAGQYQGAFPGQYQGAFPGQYQGPFPGQYQGPFPGQYQGPFPGQYQGQFPGQYQGQFPGQYQGPFPAQSPGQFSENVQPQPILNSNAAQSASETNYVVVAQTTEKADGNSNINN